MLIAFFPVNGFSFGEIPEHFSDTLKLDRQKVFAYALDGKIHEALKLLEVSDTNLLGDKDRAIKRNFENRFLYDEDRSGFAETRKSPIDSLFKIYIDFWRTSFLHPEKTNDSLLGINLASFLSKRLNVPEGRILNEDSLNASLVKYIRSKDLYTTGLGKTGNFMDLLVWKTQYDTLYKFSIHEDTVSVKVVFMDGFVTLGWEEYATLGVSYPGGWADSSGLYCVKSAYNLQSENFLVSYLAHEGRHYNDYKLFPLLSGADLEYRAKLTELSLAKSTVYDLLKFFINNANYESDNSHSVANYCVIRDLSEKIFGNGFEKDIEKWKNVDADSLNETSYRLLLLNTQELTKAGKNVKVFIKTR